MKIKNLIIVSGQLTDSNNLTGYTALGIRIHIYARQIAALPADYYTDVKLKDAAGKEITVKQLIKPLFVVADLDHTIVPQGATDPIARPTAKSVFTDRAAMVAAYVQEATIGVDIASGVAKSAASAGLTGDAAAELLASVSF